VQQQGDLILGQLADALKANSAETRLAAYKRSLLSAFSAYQELALDNYATAEQTCPDIWDIFVHPACSKEHLRPEDMDAAQMEKPTRLPATDLLPLLAQDDHRRTVLLADPGMGKSTLIQSLIAHLASGRPLAGAPVLNGLLPVPLILRDLVPLLPQDQVEGWTWDSLITVLLEHYQREETAPLLCEAYKGHEAEFRQLTQRNDRLFFLIDGLDEIGDLVKRQKIVQCIQDGIHAVSKEARWLITSRVIGYEDARLDLIRIRIPKDDFARFIPLDNSKSEPDYLLHEKVWSVICKEWVDIVTPIDPPFTDPPWDELKSTNFFQKSIPVMFGIGRKKLVAVPDKDGLDITGQICQRLFLAPFDDKRQDDFTSKWFKKRHSTDHSRELMREVRAHHHDGVRIISRVPNLLCMMNMLKRSGKPLPDGRAALYDEIVKAYLGGIDSAYKIKPILGQHQRTSAAQPTADESQKTKNKEPRTDNDSLLISVPELQTLLIPAIEAMQQAGKVKSDHTAANLLDELLHHIASRSGLLIPRSTDVSGNTVYGFTHLSFLEFFAAEWLGKEFERLQKRLARRAEALADGLELTEADLDLEFPAPQSIEHRRDDFPKLAAIPAWHESLIFLLEARKPDASTLLRWLFPALHVPKPKLGAAKQSPEIPLLPVEAVKLAIQLAHDQEISLAPATRQSWWRTLWTAYLYWPNPPWGTGKYPGWPIAPLLLGRTVNRVEVLQALIAVYPRSSLGAQPSAFPPLYLYECNSLTESDLSLLTGLTELETLRLGGCNGIERLPDLSSLRGLRTLTVPNCTGLRGAESLLSITGLVRLEALDLGGLQLVELPDISALRRLKKLDLSGCRMLESLPDLSALSRLRWLDLNGCVALKDLTELKTQLHPDCVIFGNDRMRL